MSGFDGPGVNASISYIIRRHYGMTREDTPVARLFKSSGLRTGRKGKANNTLNGTGRSSIQYLRVHKFCKVIVVSK